MKIIDFAFTIANVTGQPYLINNQLFKLYNFYNMKVRKKRNEKFERWY
jgi:hypothetical protein